MKRYFPIFVLLLAATTAHASTLFFKKHLGDGLFAFLQSETNSLSTAGEAHRYSLMVHGSESSERLIWSRDLPPYGTNIYRTPGFYFLDLWPATNGWFLCYKVWGKDLAERIDDAGQTSEPPQELNWDLYSAGLVVTKAQFSETNGVPLLRLVFKNYKAEAWTHHAAAWSRAPQYDVTVPLWARPFIPSPTAPGDQESFPALDYPDAAWGKADGEFQLGLRMEKGVFNAGERVHAIVHTRNTAHHQLTFDTTTVASNDGPVDFVVAGAQGNPVPCTAGDLAAFIPPQAKPLPGGTQNVQTFSLDRQYDLKPGDYSIVAILRVVSDTGKSLSVESGKANFRITSP